MDVRNDNEGVITQLAMQIHQSRQRGSVAGLKPRRIDEHILRVGFGVNPQNPLPRRLRLARGNADFLAD